MCRFIINTNEILENLRKAKGIVGRKVKICAVVKANAYGFGQNKICTLLKNSVDYFAVARLSEFLKYRELDINKPCLILSPLFSNELVVAIKNGAEVTVDSLETLERVERIALKFNIIAKIHIKLDTGMNRYGIKDENELKRVLERLKQCDNVKLIGCYSHLFEATSKNVVTIQRERFLCFKSIIESSNPNCLFHLANSKGLLNKENHFDMVRLGFDLYSSENSEHKFITQISAVKEVKKGETISYNANYKAKKDITIAICSAGYADGVNRHLEDFYVLINGKKARIIGNICMDSFMVDISNIEAKVCDEVVIFGKSEERVISVCDLANYCATIPYEIFTNISSRVKRVYRWRNYAGYCRKV